ncbi:hypothetical protein PCC7811_00083 [Planktothrix agardhii]|jgi:hypothetical protein|nr:hypothetical protein PCC7811_00083 [Planktothrix agardhii]
MELGGKGRTPSIDNACKKYLTPTNLASISVA